MRSRLSASAPTLPPAPVPLTSFIGREDVAASIATLLRQPETRLVTLTGAGGVGKTRVALRVAGDVAPDFPDGVGYIGLAAVEEPAFVLPAIARSLGIDESDRRSLIDRLGARLHGRTSLLVIDNFEQVIAAGPVLVELLRASPRLTLLVTSRAPLRVSGERVFPIPPLTLPPANVEVIDSEAVRLFLARAIEVRPDVVQGEATTPAIAEICRRLDGLPLAIELAAARARLLTPPAMLARLDARLPLLEGGPRDQPDRLQTMRGAIAWSHDLLTAAGQDLFRRMSAFTDGFSLDAAIAIADAPEIDVIAGLEALVDQNLVQASASDEPRYTMLETIREFGLDQLAASDASGSVRDRHAAYFLALAERVGAAVDGPEADIWLPKLDLDRCNLDQALAWLLERERAEDAQRLATALWRYWRNRGNLVDGCESLSRALALPGQSSPTVRANALWKLGYFQFYLGELAAAKGPLRQSAALYTDAGDLAGTANALDSLGIVLRLQRDFDAAWRNHERALALRRELGDQLGVEMALANLGMVALDRDDRTRARSLLTEALAMAEALASVREIGDRCTNLGRLELAEGNLPQARELADRALALFEDIGDRVQREIALDVSARIAHAAGDERRSIEQFVECLRLRLELGVFRQLAGIVEAVAVIVVGFNPRRATRWLAAAATDREATGIPPLDRHAPSLRDAIAAARAELGDARFDAQWQAGSRLAIIAAARDAVALLDEPGPVPVALLDESDESGPAPEAVAPALATLSPRETEVLRLVGAGQTNSAIAAALFISPATVKRHVTNILAKLGLTSRAAAVRTAIETGLLDD